MAIPTFIVKWSKMEVPIEGLPESATLTDLKVLLEESTGVLKHRQKILGLKCNGQPALDSNLLKDMGLKPNQKIMMVGSREETISQALDIPEDMPEVINDFEDEVLNVELSQKPENLEKIKKRVDTLEVKILNPLREGKKLLVLDIDYTLFDHRSTAETAAELKRPFLHEFLTSAYEHYDIVIWSATSMKWIEVKMTQLGVADHPAYKIAFYMDSSYMISLWTPERGLINCKPLGVIWGKYPQFSAKNTIMFDDVSRNFLMNPQCGLKIRAFREAYKNRDSDRELLRLSRYLKAISQVGDFGLLNHGNWKLYLEKSRGSRR